MKQQRVLIISHALELGGAERSLIGLLYAITNPEIRVDLFLLRHEGELMDMIPQHVNLLPEMPAYTVLAHPMKRTLREGHVLLTVARLVGKIRANIFVHAKHLKENAVSVEYSHKYAYKLMPIIQGEYDTVISFLTPHYIAAHNVEAKRKICWIHTDYSSVSIDRESELKMWSRFDKIVSISEASAEAFKTVFPELAKRVDVVENILPEALIQKQANDFSVDGEMDGDSVKLLSIGRFTTQKNFDNVPDICRFIRKKGINASWYLIGFGADEDLIRQKIRETGMEKHVIILGKKENPYPYIKACDLYVQPSRYEGKCVAVREAQMLGKPVVITAFPTSTSQLEDGVDGLIVPLDNESCADGIADLLRDKEKMSHFSSACMNRDYSNKQEVEKIYSLIGL